MSTASREKGLEVAESDGTPPATLRVYRRVISLAVAGLLGGLGYVAFQGYLTPEMLIGFASMLIICH